MRDITTTAYAVLGLLALRPRTTYELARQMQRSLRHFWPRAESNLYAAAALLVRLGLAERRAEPGRGPMLEFE